MIQRNGMTLIELLVVLAILALMTTVAVTSSDVFMSQGRYDATTRTLTDIQEAVLGPPNARQADGTLISMGFVADMGRSPQFTTFDAPGGSPPPPPPATLIGGPYELLNLPSGFAPFALVQSANDTDVVVPCGWRGPYLRLGVGQASILDGWANALYLVNAAGSQAGVDDRILAVSSGAGTGAYSSANAPLAVNVAPPQIAVRGNVYLLDSNGNPTNPTSALQVWMYGPNPLPPGGLWEVQCPTLTATDGVVSYNIPAGVYAPGCLRAYLGSSRAAATQKSPIVRFQRSGVITLNIP